MSLSLKGLVEKVYRAFKMSVGVLVGFSFVALYVYVHKYLGQAYFPVSVGAKK